MANLTRRDADVAVRPSESVPETLVGRRVCAIGFAVYAADRSAEISRGPWIALDESLGSTVVARWMRTLPAGAEIVCRVDSLMAACEAARLGMGLALLPCHLGDAEPSLARLTAPLREASPFLWLLTHEDLRRTARVRAFMEFLARRLEGDRALLEGRGA